MSTSLLYSHTLYFFKLFKIVNYIANKLASLVVPIKPCWNSHHTQLGCPTPLLLWQVPLPFYF